VCLKPRPALPSAAQLMPCTGSLDPTPCWAWLLLLGPLSPAPCHNRKSWLTCNQPSRSLILHSRHPRSLQSYAVWRNELPEVRVSQTCMERRNQRSFSACRYLDTQAFNTVSPPYPPGDGCQDHKATVAEVPYKKWRVILIIFACNLRTSSTSLETIPRLLKST
jgi:hypothetical protein